MICKPSTLTLDEFHLRRCDSLAPVNQSQAREGLAHGSTWCPVCEHMPCSSSRTRKKKIISAGNAVTLRLALPALRSASSAWRFRSITACARNRGHSGHEKTGDAHETTTGSNRQHRTFISSFAFFPVFACKGSPHRKHTLTHQRSACSEDSARHVRVASHVDTTTTSRPTARKSLPSGNCTGRCPCLHRQTPTTPQDPYPAQAQVETGQSLETYNRDRSVWLAVGSQRLHAIIGHAPQGSHQTTC